MIGEGVVYMATTYGLEQGNNELEIHPRKAHFPHLIHNFIAVFQYILVFRDLFGDPLQGPGLSCLFSTRISWYKRVENCVPYVLASLFGLVKGFGKYSLGLSDITVQ